MLALFTSLDTHNSYLKYLIFNFADTKNHLHLWHDDRQYHVNVDLQTVFGFRYLSLSYTGNTPNLEVL